MSSLQKDLSKNVEIWYIRILKNIPIEKLERFSRNKKLEKLNKLKNEIE